MFLQVVSEVEDRVDNSLRSRVDIILNMFLKDFKWAFLLREREREWNWNEMGGRYHTVHRFGPRPFYTYMKVPHSSGTRTRNKWKMYMNVEGSKTQRPCHQRKVRCKAALIRNKEWKWDKDDEI